MSNVNRLGINIYRNCFDFISKTYGINTIGIHNMGNINNYYRYVDYKFYGFYIRKKFKYIQ